MTKKDTPSPTEDENTEETKMGMMRPSRSMDDDAIVEKDDYEKDDDMRLPSSRGATSFAEIMEAEQANEAAAKVRRRASQVPELVESILTNPLIEDKLGAISGLGPEFGAVVAEEMANTTKERWQPLTDAVVNALSPLLAKQKPTKTEGGVQYPASDFAFVPDPEKPSTWKLRLAEGEAGNVTRSQLGAAAAAFSPGGFRGNKVQLPRADVPKVKARIRAAYRKLGVSDDEMPASIRKSLDGKPDGNGFTYWKQKDGRYRWLATYSNKFIDEDVPPDIIAERSHQRFVKMVNSGEYPYPELWLWHIDGSRWGEADFVGYDDRGFAVATGLVDKGKEWVADSLPKEGLLTSHGMPRRSIKRDPEESEVIIEHRTKEISPLPANIAANKFTDFNIILDEGNDMAFSEEDREKLKALKVDPDRLEEANEEKGRQTEGMKFKETEAQEAAQTADGSGADEFVSRDEVTELVKSIATSTNQLTTIVKSLVERVDSLEQNRLTVSKETLESTPAASLNDLYKSVIGSPEAKLDGRTSLAKSAPEEASADSDGLGSRFGGGIAAVISKRNRELEGAHRGGVQ